jgi:dTDP-4-amino-4,6-dideoxygalactose transaminase
MNIPFVDLSAQYQEIKNEIRSSLEGLFLRSNFILGEEVSLFEKEFAEYCGTKYAVGVNSGTDALFLALLSLGIKKGDEVILPAFTFIATALAVSFTGARPVFVDINKYSYNIDVDKISSVINKKTKAIIPVHLYGQPADMQPILKIAKRYNLKVIEDAAQAHGAKYKEKKCGSMGDIGCFSFYPAKNLGCFGDGGMAVTNNQKIYRKILMLRDYGRKKKYDHIIKGYNSRLDTIQAIVLRAKLKRLDKWNQLRQSNAAYYNKLLKDGEKIVIPVVLEDRTHIYHVYAVRVRNRDKIFQLLRKKGIGVIIHYPKPLHLQKAYKELKYKNGDFPIAEKLAKEVISLPISPHLTKKQIRFVVSQLKQIVNE